MDLNEIKQLIESDGGKFIIVENGKPLMVIISFEEYKKKFINKENNPVKKPISKELQDGELKLEDLPL